jgi:DNA-binding MarR family transcriptional regulator
MAAKANKPTSNPNPAEVDVRSDDPAFEIQRAAPTEPRDGRRIKASRMSHTVTLALWKDVTIASVSGSLPDLSARQTAVLMCVYLEEGPHTVRSLASRLNVTKAVISRAIDRLKSYEFILRADDPRDRRSIVLRRTPEGINYLRSFASIIQSEMPDNLLPTPQR